MELKSERKECIKTTWSYVRNNEKDYLRFRIKDYFYISPDHYYEGTVEVSRGLTTFIEKTGAYKDYEKVTKDTMLLVAKLEKLNFAFAI